MARKNVLQTFPMFGSSGADMSSATTTSSVTSVTYMDNVGIQMSWSGTSPVGSAVVQVSNNYDSTHPVNATWVNLDFGSSISVSGNTGNNTITINQLPFSFIRMVYTKVSGTGTLLADISAKQLGG